MFSPLFFLVGGEFAGLMFQGGAAPISQDAWMWKSPLPPALSDIDFKLGKPGCDNRFAYELRTAGVRVYICISVYTCIFVYLYNICTCIYIYIYIYVYIRAYSAVEMVLSESCMQVWSGYICTKVYYLYTYICSYKKIHLYIYIYIHIYICMCLYIHIYTCVGMYLYMNM